MGIPKQTIELIEIALKNLKISYEQCKMGELGNQHIRFHPKEPAKKFFKNLGVDHHSFDINGLDGSHKIDLCNPISDPEFLEKFDIVTNFGTSEHVKNQTLVFENIDILCRPGGIMIHTVPFKGNWPGHCEFYYDEDYFKKLAKKFDYEIIKIEKDPSRGTGRHNVAAIFKKRKNEESK